MIKKNEREEKSREELFGKKEIRGEKNEIYEIVSMIEWMKNIILRGIIILGKMIV